MFNGGAYEPVVIVASGFICKFVFSFVIFSFTMRGTKVYLNSLIIHSAIFGIRNIVFYSAIIIIPLASKLTGGWR